MEKHHKFSVWYVLIAVWIVLILHNLIVQMFAVERVPYSDFVKALQAGKVLELAITQDRIQGKMKVADNGHDSHFAVLEVHQFSYRTGRELVEVFPEPIPTGNG